MASSNVLAVIPARYGSTRFPGKPLARIKGLPMILHVARGAKRIKGVDRVMIATDDSRICDVVTADGHEAVITAKNHKSGTSRVAEVASGVRSGLILNIQGDEPVVPAGAIERLIGVMSADRSCQMGTLAARSKEMDDFRRSDVVKTAVDRDGNALYFSRAPIPHEAETFLHHIGVYLYRRDFLLRFTDLPRGPLEKREKLEQLRALENGFDIRVVTCRAKSLGVDRPEDIKRVEKRIKRN